jgi:hypothetical protein
MADKDAVTEPQPQEEVNFMPEGGARRWICIPGGVHTDHQVERPAKPEQKAVSVDETEKASRRISEYDHLPLD